MANFVTNRIRLIGNSNIENLSNEIARRINEDIEKSGDRQDLGLVERVFYGQKQSDINWCFNNIGSKWICAGHDSGDIDEHVFSSGWTPVFKFQDYLLKHAAKIDPKVVIQLNYDDEMPNFVGSRYVLLDGNNVKEFHSELDTSNYTVVMEDEVDETKEALREEGEDDSLVIWWEDLWDLLREQNKIALNRMQAEYKYTKSIKSFN
jgi:hypothetical protein